MAIFSGNEDLLIAAPMLQDSFVDKTGIPMAGGIITCYQDNSRTTFKNWYYQSGTPGNYDYITLPNPLTLSAAGTICDINGVDTIPFFYPYSLIDETVVQPYYITIVNYAMTNQITRANFPFLPPTGSNQRTSNSFDNYIINNEFWRNIGTQSLTNTLLATVAPSQHDGFNNPDITFQKNITGGTDVVTFTKFPLTTTPILEGDITPEFYLNHTCSNTPTGETQKAYFFPISLHVNTLASVPFTVTIQAQSVSGSDVISLFIYQFTGTGTSSPAPSLIESVTLIPAWKKYSFTSIFPETAGLTLGNGGDDALFLIVELPTNTPFSINFAKPSIYLSQIIPTNNFQTYDQIDAIINSPRTGDLRISINSFYYFGWVPMNDGTIGNSSSNATARNNNDTWQLYNLIWNLCAPYSASGAGTTNPLAQMYTSTGTPVGYGANISVPTTAYGDFNANHQLSLTSTMGSVLIGTVPLSALLAATPTLTGYTSIVTASSSTGLLFTTATANILNSFLGNTITFTGTAALVNVSANIIYYMIPITSTTFKIATTFANAIAGSVVSYTGAETGTVTTYLQQTASFEGEYAHTQLSSELAAHNHTPLSGNFVTDVAFNNETAAGGNKSYVGISATTNTVGSSTPFNITQPGVFYNIFIKL